MVLSGKQVTPDKEMKCKEAADKFTGCKDKFMIPLGKVHSSILSEPLVYHQVKYHKKTEVSQPGGRGYRIP